VATRQAAPSAANRIAIPRPKYRREAPVTKATPPASAYPSLLDTMVGHASDLIIRGGTGRARTGNAPGPHRLTSCFNQWSYPDRSAPSTGGESDSCTIDATGKVVLRPGFIGQSHAPYDSPGVLATLRSRRSPLQLTDGAIGGQLRVHDRAALTVARDYLMRIARPGGGHALPRAGPKVFPGLEDVFGSTSYRIDGNPLSDAGFSSSVIRRSARVAMG